METMPTNWAFDQFNEYNFSGGFGLDKDAVSGRDNGFVVPICDNYDRQAARNYMERYANEEEKKRNPDFFDYDYHNCANFVSQCILAGGFPMVKGKWFYFHDGRCPEAWSAAQ